MRQWDFGLVWRLATDDLHLWWCHRRQLPNGALVAVGLLALTCGGMPAAAAGVQDGGVAALQPHRAVYDLKLSKTRPSSKVTSVTGRMVYELTGSACAGWSQNMRIVTETVTSEGESTLSDQRSTSWEDSQGRKMTFEWMVYRDRQLVESTAGVATREPGEGGDIKVDLTTPERRQVEVSGSALFPVQHSLHMLDAARSSERVFKADFYDGSENAEKVYLTTTYIGKKLADGNKKLPKVANAERLDTVAAWPVSISYFEPDSGKQDAVPSYELSFLMFENGVSRRLFMDYGEHAMEGELTSITFLEPQRCR